jgi:O-antigen/teichoic acid export membrane protein
MTKNYMQNVAVKSLSGAIAFVMNYAAGAVMARALGAEGYGTVTMLVLVPTAIAMLGSLGVDKANGYLAGAKKHAPEALLNNAVMLTVVITLLTGIGYWVFLPYTMMAVSVDGTGRPLLILVFLAVPFSLLEAYLQGILWGQERITQLSVVSIIRFASLLILNVVLILGLGLGVWGAVLAAVSTPGICAAMYLLLLRKDISLRWHWEKKVVQDSLVFGIQAHLGSVLHFLGSRLDVFVINIFLGASDVGFYAVSVALAEMLLYVPMAFAFALFPKTAASDSETAKRFTPRVARLSGLFTIATAMGLFLVSKLLIVLLYTDEFLPAMYPLWILIPGAVAASYAQVIFSDLGGRGKPYYATLAAFLSLFVTVGVDFLLIPRWGIIGAATASSLSRLTSAAVAVVIYLRLTGNRLGDVLFIQKRDIGDGLDSGRRAILSVRKSLHARGLLGD